MDNKFHLRIWCISRQVEIQISNVVFGNHAYVCNQHSDNLGNKDAFFFYLYLHQIHQLLPRFSAYRILYNIVFSFTSLLIVLIKIEPYFQVHQNIRYSKDFHKPLLWLSGLIFFSPSSSFLHLWRFG